MIDFDTLQLTAEKLQKYAEIDGSEIGELCISMIQLSRYSDYVSEEFVDALYAEMVSQLENFEECATIVETEETFTRKVVYLEWE
jgi:hypothetical protein